MPIVNFAVPRTLEKKVNKAIRERGFASKAEFWRMAGLNFSTHDPEQKVRDEIRQLTKQISEQVRIKFNGKKIPSLKEQLADM
ncbi:MAG TPA: hypothetical protein VJJ22_03555 [Candidatus Paceibacterota bacterium]